MLVIGKLDALPGQFANLMVFGGENATSGARTPDLCTARLRRK